MDAPTYSDADIFHKLMERLAEDGDAEERYESLRRRLISFFRLHVPIEADALADRVLDRVARKLVDGTQIENVSKFTLGVSRMILMESRARHSRELHALHGAAQSIDPPATPPDQRAWEEEETELALRVNKLRGCLAKMGDSASYVILTYYAADGSARILARQRLAAELGLSVNALRNRAHRLRDLLERCLATNSLRDEKQIDDTCLMSIDQV